MLSKLLRILGKVLQKLAIVLVSAVVLGVLGEVVARLAEPGPFSLLDENPYLRNQNGLKQLHKPNFEGRWDGTWYATNSLGLRGPEIAEEKSEDEFRVVAVGDSCTFGKSVVEADTWPRQLETMLQSEIGAKRAVVANCGVNGFAGKDYQRMLKAIGLKLQPDVVVIGYNLNDFPNVLSKINVTVVKENKTKQTVKKIVGGQKNLDLFNETALYRFARAVYRDSTRAKAWEDSEEFAKENADQLKTMQRAANKAKSEEHMEALAAEVATLKEMVEGAGAKLALFLFPYESQVYLEEYDRSPIERLRQICLDLDVPFVDLAEEFREVAFETDPPREMYVFGDQYHPRPIGYQIVAENVMEVLKERDWLPQD